MRTAVISDNGDLSIAREPYPLEKQYCLREQVRVLKKGNKVKTTKTLRCGTWCPAFDFNKKEKWLQLCTNMEIHFDKLEIKNAENNS